MDMSDLYLRMVPPKDFSDVPSEDLELVRCTEEGDFICEIVRVVRGSPSWNKREFLRSGGMRLVLGEIRDA